jgi:hypothetical protein
VRSATVSYINTAALPSAPNYEKLWKSGVYSCIVEEGNKLQNLAALFSVPTGQNALWAEENLSG